MTVTSVPTIEKGEGLKLQFVACKVGSKEMSKGRAEMSVVVMFGRSMSSFVEFEMCPASASAGWRAVAQLSLMK